MTGTSQENTVAQLAAITPRPGLPSYKKRRRNGPWPSTSCGFLWNPASPSLSVWDPTPSVGAAFSVIATTWQGREMARGRLILFQNPNIRKPRFLFLRLVTEAAPLIEASSGTAAGGSIIPHGPTWNCMASQEGAGLGGKAKKHASEEAEEVEPNTPISSVKIFMTKWSKPQSEIKACCKLRKNAPTCMGPAGTKRTPAVPVRDPPLAVGPPPTCGQELGPCPRARHGADLHCAVQEG